MIDQYIFHTIWKFHWLNLCSWLRMGQEIGLQKPIVVMLWYLVKTGILLPCKFYQQNMHSFKKATINCIFNFVFSLWVCCNQVYTEQTMQKDVFMVCLTAEGEACHWLGSLVYVSPYCNLHTWTGQHKKREERPFLVDNISHHLR